MVQGVLDAHIAKVVKILIPKIANATTTKIKHTSSGSVLLKYK